MGEITVPCLLTAPLPHTQQRKGESTASQHPAPLCLHTPLAVSHICASSGQTPRSVSSQQSHASCNSRSSIDSWLDQTTETLTPTQTSYEQDVQVNHPKRKWTPSPDLEEPEPRPVVPLTRTVLKQHLAFTMSSDQSTSQTLTPRKDTSTSASSYQTPTNPSNSSSKPSLPPDEVRYHMEAHRMFIDKRVLSKPEMAGFCNLVMTVADTERPSGRKPESEKRWQNRIDKIHVHNEATMLDHVLPLLVKSAGDLRKAVNQACRGGTVAVRIQRLLLEAIGQDTMREGPDRQTYVYTGTIDDNQMSFWVNFAVVKTASPSAQKIVSYHMEHVYSYNFRSPDAELYLRRVCHNILDWGVRSRRQMLQERCSKMYKSERLAIDRDVEELRAQATAAAAAKVQEQANGNKKRKLGPGS
ncbi:MAG: hypothetical protein Q9193_003780, partial [Seirophora villosa]